MNELVVVADCDFKITGIRHVFLSNDFDFVGKLLLREKISQEDEISSVACGQVVFESRIWHLFDLLDA